MSSAWYDKRGNILVESNLDPDDPKWHEQMGVLEKFLGDYGYKVVGRTKGVDKDGVKLTVSTVWLGLEHGRDENNKPLIFETMVFGYPDSEPMDRYGTEEEAKEGHERFVKEYLV